MRVMARPPNSVTLGLIFTPELPEKICREIASSLPALLSQQVDDRVSRNVSVLCEPLVGGHQEDSQILDMARERMLEKGWNLALCLTDHRCAEEGSSSTLAPS